MQNMPILIGGNVMLNDRGIFGRTDWNGPCKINNYGIVHDVTRTRGQPIVIRSKRSSVYFDLSITSNDTRLALSSEVYPFPIRGMRIWSLNTFTIIVYVQMFLQWNPQVQRRTSQWRGRGGRIKITKAKNSCKINRYFSIFTIFAFVTLWTQSINIIIN